MLSRHADACYWIGRYVERAEATARMVDVHYHAALESGLPPEGEYPGETASPMRWQSLLAISGTEKEYYARHETENDRDVMEFFAFDTTNPHSIISVWKNARANARAIREQIASEMWESLNVSYLELLEWNVDRALLGSPYEFFQVVKNASHLFQGILNRTMLMGEARDWLDTGRFLERGVQTARLLDVKYHDLLPAYQDEGNAAARLGVEPLGVGSMLDTHGWIAVLKSVSAFEMFRKTYKTGIRPASVVDFLILNPDFPASARHCIGRVESCLRRISGSGASEPATEPERIIGRLLAELKFSRPDEIIVSGLHEFLDDMQTRCMAVGDAITQTYLLY